MQATVRAAARVLIEAIIHTVAMADEVDAYLETQAAQVREIAERTRRLVREEMPTAVEWLTGWKTVAYGPVPKMSQVVYALVFHGNYVNLEFAAGVNLPDPAGLLEGTGKSLRHVKLRSTADVERPEVRELVRAAVSAKPTWKR